MFFIETFITLPTVGNIVTTDTGSGEVCYVSTRIDSAIIYIKNASGVFDITDDLYINEQNFAGTYTEESTYTATGSVGGFWYISTPSYSNNSTYYDEGRGLVYADVRLQGSVRELNNYYNIQNTVGTIGTYVTNKNQVSYFEQLSYRGDPSGADAQDGVERDLPSNKWIARAGTAFSDTLSLGQL